MDLCWERLNNVLNWCEISRVTMHALDRRRHDIFAESLQKVWLSDEVLTTFIEVGEKVTKLSFGHVILQVRDEIWKIGTVHLLALGIAPAVLIKNALSRNSASINGAFDLTNQLASVNFYKHFNKFSVFDASIFIGVQLIEESVDLVIVHLDVHGFNLAFEFVQWDTLVVISVQNSENWTQIDVLSTNVVLHLGFCWWKFTLVNDGGRRMS